MIRCAVLCAVFALLAAGCLPPLTTERRATVAPLVTTSPEPLQTIAPQPTSAPGSPAPPGSPTPPPVSLTPAPSATPARAPGRGFLGLNVAAGAPVQGAEGVLSALAASGIKAERVLNQSDLELAPQSVEDSPLVYERIFTPVDRMSSILDSITLAELKAVWTGSGETPNFTSIYVSQDEVAELSVVLGQASGNVKPTPSDGLEAAVWGDKMGLGILPFDRLTIRLRAIALDRQSPVDNRFNAAEWPLTSRAYLAPKTKAGRDALGKIRPGVASNREVNQLTVLVMTGVTAMARNSAVAIERADDYGFLARQVGPELAAADITTISNEIPFQPGCVPNNTLNNLLLCSKPEYWENLTLSGVDAIGLTGNHMNDFGYDNFRWTLDFYTQKGIP